MSDRDFHVGTRITAQQYKALRRAAEAQALTVAEWIRLAVLRRISGEDSTAAGLIRDVLAARILLLNVLYFLGPDGNSLGRDGLKQVPRRASESSQSQLQTLLSLDSEGAEPSMESRMTQGQSIKARLTEAQHETVTLSATAAGSTVSDWLRVAVVTDLERSTLLQILSNRVLALRSILEESVTTLVTDGGQLDRNAIAILTKRTDPVAAGSNTTRPSRREESPQ